MPGGGVRWSQLRKRGQWVATILSWVEPSDTGQHPRHTGPPRRRARPCPVSLVPSARRTRFRSGRRFKGRRCRAAPRRRWGRDLSHPLRPVRSVTWCQTLGGRMGFSQSTREERSSFLLHSAFVRPRKWRCRANHCSSRKLEAVRWSLVWCPSRDVCPAGRSPFHRVQSPLWSCRRSLCRPAHWPSALAPRSLSPQARGTCALAVPTARHRAPSQSCTPVPSAGSVPLGTSRPAPRSHFHCLPC